MPRKQASTFVPLKPDRVRASGGTEYIRKIEPAPEKHYDLEGCPLCGKKSRMEVSGNGLYPLYNVVCGSCGCSSGSYRNPLWAAKRWNTRKGQTTVEVAMDKSAVDRMVQTFEPVFIQERDAPAEESQAAKKRQKAVKDLPGQMLFDF